MKNTERGFTLLEMMVALMVGVIVSLSLGIIAKTMTMQADTQQLLTEASESARAALDMLRFDFMRAGMFVAANPRSDENPNSLVTSTGPNGTQAGYYRNAIVHLNPNAKGPDSVVLVGNFIGDRAYEGEVQLDDGVTLTVTSTISARQCMVEFDPAYAFVHIITGTGQTHEAKIASRAYINCDSTQQRCQCRITTEQGELIEDAFNERHVKIAANQAVMYRVEQLQGRKVLMRYFIDYDGTTAQAHGCTAPVAAADYIDVGSAKVVAENVVDFQVWFRAIDPLSVPQAADWPRYHPLADIATAGVSLLPVPENVIVGNASPQETNTKTHLTCPAAGGNAGLIGPEHVRSAIISVAVRTAQPDPNWQIEYDVDTADTDIVDAGFVMDRALRPTGAGQTGYYIVRRYTIEVPLPNITAQMANFQWQGTPPAY